jgi:hypothetical protein
MTGRDPAFRDRLYRGLILAAAKPAAAPERRAERYNASSSSSPGAAIDQVTPNESRNWP